MSTGIQWTNETWNPITGCSKVSQGCKFCYAERIWKKVYGLRPFTDVKFHPDRLEKPLSWKQPRMIFVNSMSDLFHEDVSIEDFRKIWDLMVRTPQHTYQVLTKRPERMWSMLGPEGIDFYRSRTAPCPQPNIWLGTSVENQKTADERIPHLLRTPAAVRWISAEPLLDSIDLAAYTRPYHYHCCVVCGWVPIEKMEPYLRIHGKEAKCIACNHHLRTQLDWVVVGGESGTREKARKFDLRWAYDIVEECKDADVPVFVKQFGRNPYFSGGDGAAALVNIAGIKDSHGGQMSEWPEDLRIREYPLKEDK